MRTLVGVAGLCLVAAQGPLAQGRSPHTLEYQPFDIPNARLTRPFGVNASGNIAGLFRDAANVNHGFIRHPDGSVDAIDYPGATFTNATGINARGDVVGRWTDHDGFNHGFVRTSRGDFSPIDPLSPCVVTKQATVVHGINDIGDLAGRCFDANGKELGWVWRQDGSFQTFDTPAFLTTDAWSSSDTGVVVGDYTDQNAFVHGFIWSERHGFATLDVDGNQTGVRAVNNRGDVTGIYVAAGRTHGFLLRDGALDTVDYPGALNASGTLLINNSAVIVGGFIDATGEHGFIAR
jgi:hypothetical protein